MSSDDLSNDIPSLLVFIAASLIGLFVYIVPAMIAFKRDHPNRVGILIVNLFLGYTLVGWVVALVWALSASRVEASATPFAASAPPVTVMAPVALAAEKKCPSCAEVIKAAAVKCRFCGYQYT